MRELWLVSVPRPPVTEQGCLCTERSWYREVAYHDAERLRRSEARERVQGWHGGTSPLPTLAHVEVPVEVRFDLNLILNVCMAVSS